MMDVQQVAGDAGRVVLAASGQVDLATAPQLTKAVSQAQGEGVHQVVIDLTSVDFLDSAGVRALVQASREADAAGARLYLQGAHSWVARVLEITGLADYLPPPPPPGGSETMPPPGGPGG